MNAKAIIAIIVGTVIMLVTSMILSSHAQVGTPVPPRWLYQLKDDSTHRVVTDEQIARWDAAAFSQNLGAIDGGTASITNNVIIDGGTAQ